MPQHDRAQARAKHDRLVFSTVGTIPIEEHTGAGGAGGPLGVLAAVSHVRVWPLGAGELTKEALAFGLWLPF
jgi:hypothetical protein